MKKIFSLACFISAVMLLLPLCKLTKPLDVIANAVSKEESYQKVEPKLYESFSVLNKETGEITEMSAQDYIFSVVAAEMPVLYEPEALKAQAVAAYTYACRKKVLNESENYDITTDFSVDQGFITEEKARENWGENADIYVEKIKKAVADTAGFLVTYNGDLANTVYHAISSGKTESCKDIWGSDLAYLTAVSSSWDTQASDYKTTVTLSSDELKEKLKATVEFSGEEKSYFSNIVKTDSGAVKTVTICGKEYSGNIIRESLALRSQNFDVTFDNGSFIFSVYGYGHGVGMSQFGANAMAKQGSDFKEILTHYYSGCTVEKI